MKNAPTLALLAALALGVTACESNFTEINTNPNSPEEARPELLLPTLITTSADHVARLGWYNGNLVTQLTAKNNFTGFDRYLWGSESGHWNTMYQVMRDAHTLEEIGAEAGHANYQALGLIFQSFAAALLTDAYGDVPYSEAVEGKAEGNFTPAYDPQQEIYAGILADLERAADLLDPSGPAIGGDPLYDGDLDRWKRFANALRLRYLLRISGQQDVAAELRAAAAEPLFAGNEDQASLRYLASAPNQFFMHTGRVGGFDEHRLSRTSERALKATDDPRLAVWFRDLENPDSTGIFRGMPNGLSESTAYDFNGGSQANVSRLGTIFREEPDGASGILMSFAEQEFILAEAALRRFTSGDAANHYRRGIEASMDFWGATPPDGFYEQDQITLSNDPGRALEQIMTQKWLALFMSGLEGWSNWRRTGLPDLQPSVDNVNQDRIPVRFLYPDTEQTLNAESYAAAVQRQGPDDINTPVWWMEE